MLIGYYPTTVDAGALLEGVLHTYNGKGAGDNNTGRYSNPKLDALLLAARVELDSAKRVVLLEEVQLLIKEDIAIIPIHQQLPSWAMRKNVDTPARLDNGLDLRWVVVR